MRYQQFLADGEGLSPPGLMPRAIDARACTFPAKHEKQSFEGVIPRQHRNFSYLKFSSGRPVCLQNPRLLWELALESSCPPSVRTTLEFLHVEGLLL